MFTNGLFRSGRRQKSNVYIQRHQGAKCARRALVRDLSQIFTRHRFLYAQWEKRKRHVRIVELNSRALTHALQILDEHWHVMAIQTC